VGVDGTVGQPPHRFGSRWKLWLLMSLLVILSIEGLLQLAALSNKRVNEILTGVPRTLPDPVLRVRPNPALPDHDAAGWRNAERLARAEIVAIGDSQTYGDEVARANAWPQQLAARTGLRVYNMAQGGYGPAQYGALVDEAMALSPRWIFVGFYAGNDLADTYKSVYDSAVFAELRSRDAAVLARLDASAGSGDLSDAWRATKTARKGRLKVTFTRWIGEPIRSGSRIYGLIRGLTRLGAGPISLRQDTDHTRFDKYAAVVENADPNLLFALSAGAVSTVLTPAARHAVLDRTDARVVEGLRISLDIFAQIDARCAQRCRVAIVLIPTKELVYADTVHRVGASVPPVYADLVHAEREMWQLARAGLARLGVAWIDTLPSLASRANSSERPYLADWNGHPNAAGNAAIAEAVASFLAAQSGASSGRLGSE
jgi:lysophospholipase L1-like esterase